MEAARKDVDKPKELTSTNHAQKRMQRLGWDWGGDVGWMRHALTGFTTFHIRNLAYKLTSSGPQAYERQQILIYRPL